MGLINPKPRFAYDDEANAIYDYVKQRDAALTDRYSAADGEWNLFEVKRLILAGQPVEGARVPSSSPPPSTTPSPGMVFAPGSTPPVGSTDNTLGQDIPHVKTALSVAQLLGIRLSALQAAALGITPVQMSATGVTAEQVTAWALTAERADALKLTAEQRAVLMP